MPHNMKASLTTLESTKMIVAAYSGGQPSQTCARLSFCEGFHMDNADLLRELVATYQKHGWELQRTVKVADFDALWFSRASHGNREAWELRLVSQTQYALFEAFESDETEEQRDEVRLEMEARMRDYVQKT